MSVNILTLDELTSNKLNNIAQNIMIGPQASIMDSLNNINRTHGLDLGVTKTFRWSPGVYDKIKDKLTEYNGFNMGNSGMYHLFRRMEENHTWYKRGLKEKVVGLEREMQRLRDQSIVWQDNTDSTLDIYHLIKEKLDETYDNLNDDVQIRTNIVEVTNNDTNDILFNEYKIRFLIEYNNIDVHLWTNSTNRYLGAAPTGPITLNIQMNLIRALNHLSVRQNNIFNIVNLPANYFTEGSVFNIRGAYDSNVKLNHPYISDRPNSGQSRGVSMCEETERIDWRNVCTGDMGSKMALKCVNFDLTEINAVFKQWLSNFIVTHTHPLNSFRTWFHGLPKWLKEAEDLHAIIGHSEYADDCHNSTLIVDKEGDGRDFTDNINYCNESECQLKADCNTFQRLADPEYMAMRNQLVAELSLILEAVPYDVEHNWRFTDIDNLNLIVSQENADIRQEHLEEAMYLYSKIYPKSIYADLNSFVEQRGIRLFLTHTLMNYVHDLRKEYELVQEGYKSGRPTTEAMSDEEMVAELQRRSNRSRGLIATHPQTSNELTDEEWEEIERTEAAEEELMRAQARDEADEAIVWEQRQRDIIENPEPNNQEEE